MEKHQEKDLTFYDILGSAFKHKVLIAIITIAITIIGTLYIALIGNKNKTYYESTFQLQYPESKTLTNPDGSQFDMYSIISLESLNNVKKSDKKYEDINVQNMYFDNGITISSESVEENNKTITKFTVSAKSTYFNSRELAKDFISEVAKMSLSNIMNNFEEIQQTGYESSYGQLLDYNDILNLFDLQTDTLISSYTTKIDSFGNLLVNDKNLTIHRLEIENYATSNSTDLLRGEIKANGYANRSDVLAQNYQIKIDILNKEKDANLIILSELNSVATNNQSAQKRITELTERNVVISNEIDLLNEKIAFANGTKNVENDTAYKLFVDKINAYHEKMLEFTDLHTSNIEAIYKRSVVKFDSPSIISTTGDTSIIIAGAISLVIGFVLSMAVALIISGIERKKEECEQTE